MSMEASPAQGRSGTSAANARLMRLATYAAVSAAALLILLKGAAYFYTGSLAMLASLTDSLLDGAASLLNVIAVRHSLTPPDKEHRFGHGKAEALAAMGQSLFVAGSACFLLYEGFHRLMSPEPVDHGLAGIVVIIVAIAVTLALVSFQKHVIAKTESLAIQADSIHYAGDLLMNIGVLIALVLSGLFGLPLADAVFGIAIACLIAWSAFKISRSAYDQLMDREMEEEDREKIKAAARRHPHVADLHSLRTRMVGAQRFIQFHLELDPDIRLIEAHEIAVQVMRDVQEIFPGSEVLIHEDPAGHEIVPAKERL